MFVIAFIDIYQARIHKTNEILNNLTTEKKNDILKKSKGTTCCPETQSHSLLWY